MPKCDNAVKSLVSPREKHIPDDAQRTSICLTAEDRAAVRWINEVRRAKKDKRTTTNDILVDALWYFLEKTESRTRDQIRGTLPPVAPVLPPAPEKVTEIHKPKKKR
ncbi:MAG: hypothetical protein HYX28_04860 [Candidatus Koribacter versatilis]|uniref:Uncharacterized protein n=1 Tax=Candidatus Korobacter versatilis TaxID=658062 RepID=A0A932EPG0_9BACT|nr:hypothetical protein [Candidatus Koribacter versatilis]